jgi:hypothetical protein
MKSLIVFSHFRWDLVYQRPQRLLTRLARKWRVLFVEEPVFGTGPARRVALAAGRHHPMALPCCRSSIRASSSTTASTWRART